MEMISLSPFLFRNAKVLNLSPDMLLATERCGREVVPVDSPS